MNTHTHTEGTHPSSKLLMMSQMSMLRVQSSEGRLELVADSGHIYKIRVCLLTPDWTSQIKVKLSKRNKTIKHGSKHEAAAQSDEIWVRTGGRGPSTDGINTHRQQPIKRPNFCLFIPPRTCHCTVDMSITQSLRYFLDFFVNSFGENELLRMCIK